MFGLEPATHPPAGDQAARDAGTMIWLEAGEARTYSLRFTVVDSAAAVADLESTIRTTHGQPGDA